MYLLACTLRAIDGRLFTGGQGLDQLQSWNSMHDRAVQPCSSRSTTLLVFQLLPALLAANYSDQVCSVKSNEETPESSNHIEAAQREL